MDYNDLFAAVLLSFVIERVMAVFFDFTGLGENVKLHGEKVAEAAPSFQGASFKGLIAAFIAIIICVLADINVINEIIKNAKATVPLALEDGAGQTLGQFMSGIFIAGGSQGSVKLFQDVLGFSKANRDIIKRSNLEAQKAKEEKAKRDQVAAKLERTRLENALVTAANEEKLASFRAETNAKLAQIERRKNLKDAERRAGVSVDPILLSSPVDPYLKDVIENWDEFVTLRAELKAEAKGTT